MATNHTQSSSQVHDQKMLSSVLAQDRVATREFAARLLGIIRPVARYELRRWPQQRIGGRDVDDMCSEIFVMLFANDAKALRRWDLTRSTLETIARIYARSRIRDIARRERRRLKVGGWPTSLDDAAEPEARAHRPDELAQARDLAGAVVTTVRAEYPSALAAQMIELLLVRQVSTDDAARLTKRTRAQIFSWRSRLLKCAREQMRTTYGMDARAT